MYLMGDEMAGMSGREEIGQRHAQINKHEEWVGFAFICFALYMFYGDGFYKFWL